VIRETFAEDFIANCSIPGIVDLMPDDSSMALKEQMKDMKAGASLLTLYLGLSKPLRELGSNSYSICVYDSSVRSLADISHNNKDEFSRRNFILVDYGQIDSGLSSGDKSVAGICCVDYFTQWEKLGREEYNLKKEETASLLTDRLERIIPGIRSIIVHSEVATSATVNRYTLNPEGAVYGFVQTPGKKAVNTNKVLENLHVASAWGKTGGGFSGAISGGYFCALNVLRKKAGRRI